MKGFWGIPISAGVVAYLGVAPLNCTPGYGCSGIVAWNHSSHANAFAFGAAIGIVAWLLVLTVVNWDGIGRAGRAVARTMLLLTTLLCLASMGGAMLGAFPVLAPLLALMIRSSTPTAAVLWLMLGLLAVAEAAYMYTYVFPSPIALFLSEAMVIGGMIAMITGLPIAVRRNRTAKYPSTC